MLGLLLLLQEIGSSFPNHRILKDSLGVTPDFLNGKRFCQRISGGSNVAKTCFPGIQNKTFLRERWKRRILVTGGCGFLGSAVVDFLTVSYQEDLTVALDWMDECASLENIKEALPRENFVFLKGDVS